jgi:hypothetical protein
MAMLDSTNAKHKLFIAGILLALFAVPFALEWSRITAMDGQALLAGGAVVGGAAPENISAATSSNNASQAAYVTGRTFTGVLAR